MGSRPPTIWREKQAVRRVAVLERGWLGRRQYRAQHHHRALELFLRRSARLYDFSLKLYEAWRAELNFNIMLSQRGLLELAHSRARAGLMRAVVQRHPDERHRRGNARRRRDPAHAPLLEVARARFPVLGGFIQRRAGIARHDAVAWGYARGAEAPRRRHHPELRGDGFSASRADACSGVETTPRTNRRRHVGMRSPATLRAGGSWPAFACRSRAMALQAMVTEPVKPVLDTVVLSGRDHAYVSQSDGRDGDRGGSGPVSKSYAQRGASP